MKVIVMTVLVSVLVAGCVSMKPFPEQVCQGDFTPINAKQH